MKTIPTSELPTPSFLHRTDPERTQPIFRHRKSAYARVKAQRERDAALHSLDRALDFRNQSFVGFRGDLWREWREGMREAALEFRRACGHLPGFALKHTR